jgi:hypothetical protein
MKKALLCCVLMMAVAGVLSAGISFYGSARLGFWYEYTDKDWNMYNSDYDDTNLEMNYFMQGNSRFGANVDLNGVTGKLELGISPSKVCLRLLYGKMTKGDLSLVIGQDYTGFNVYGDQVYGSDNCFIKYGLFYDGRQPLVKLGFNNKLYVMFVVPNENDVTELGGLQTIIPKINAKYEMAGEKLYLAASAGVNMNKYNKNVNTDQLDDSILSYAVALTGKYNLGAVTLLAHYGYGVNLGNYGMLTITPSSIVYNTADKSFEDTKTFGGLFILESGLLNAGVSYIQTCNSLWSDKDTAMSAFVQKKISLCEKVCLVPEVGLVDNMKDQTGAQEGKKFYAGTKIQADF